MYNLDLETLKVNQYIFKHKKEFNKEIGLKIKEIRLSKNISTSQMATRTMMSPTYIIQIENGVYGLTLNKFMIICNALEVESKDILDDFIFSSKYNDDLIYNELQNEKNLTKNISNYMKNKK